MLDAGHVTNKQHVQKGCHVLGSAVLDPTSPLFPA